MRLLVPALLLVAACGPDRAEVRRPGTTEVVLPTQPTEPTDPTGTVTTTTPTEPTDDPTGGSTITEPLEGFVGSPCASDADCAYDDGVCLKEAEGFPLGTCSAACDQYCPDATGFPTTFCVDSSELPADVAWLGDGGCLQRCDFGAYPYTGCRQDYGCVEAGRANEPGTETYVCMPNEGSGLSTCLQDLADRGVPFSPTIIADDSPSDAPSLTCHVEEPISFQSGYLGVDLLYHTDNSPGSVSGSCEFGHALADTVEDVEPDGTTAIRHLGTYVCRTIGGTSTLSRHAYGDAIDIWGFDFSNGDQYILEDHWEHDTTNPSSIEGAWLYDTAYGWHDQLIWTIILTPNYNSAHDNHFHIDITPNSDFIGFAGPYFGPDMYDH